MQQEPLVLLGGHTCDARIFGPQISEFSKDRMVVVPLYRMTGRIVPEYIRDCCRRGFGRFLARWNCCTRSPDRVTRIALISTNALSDTPRIFAREADITKARACAIC